MLTNASSSAGGNLRTYLGIPVVVAERTGSVSLSLSLFLYLSSSLSLLLAAVENSFSTEPPFILTAYITAPAENLISWQISLRARSNFHV